MKKNNLRAMLSVICLMSIVATFVKVEAGPVRFDQVVQIMNPTPGKAETSSFTRIRLVNYYDGFVVGDDGDDDKKAGITKQDGRVITETKTDIVEDDVCDCVEPEVVSKFPKWALLGLAAIPVALILIKRKKDEPTPTTPTPTPTPTVTPTPTPTVTPTPTPPEPVPEPVTILLFGTGLASIGLAARRKFGKKKKGEEEGK
ncbi:MAG TPA: PEP-CTERM sorting domain-containing protein [Pyrinomonadaceae bacterium]|nr:PEP-CTERM sorting domain-containing protein [Chloracidobacterium sp.]HQY67032.1 PEP-CTERM sorting domain-containing protein [Pyrinomonadaceae bacterium]MBK7802465.1 PEP-CTERM sorting domain-containing protein [Chloracidobacterium sp.]MBK9437334.1 PEP-CTERM sorting domain-containing protein [Chloracidobacterium sp.]MBK9766062.1 PEP-CTERM sorting domain-containing protein [Chloracidobacterium sp.]